MIAIAQELIDAADDLSEFEGETYSLPGARVRAIINRHHCGPANAEELLINSIRPVRRDDALRQ